MLMGVIITYLKTEPLKLNINHMFILGICLFSQYHPLAFNFKWNGRLSFRYSLPFTALNICTFKGFVKRTEGVENNTTLLTRRTNPLMKGDYGSGILDMIPIWSLLDERPYHILNFANGMQIVKEIPFSQIASY